MAFSDFFVPTETVNNDFARRVALSLEVSRGRGYFESHLPDSFQFRGGGPDPKIGVASPVVVRSVS
jgi:hypothetical protein